MSVRHHGWISDARQFEALREPWNRLAGGNPFLTHAWFDCWWRSYSGGAEMRVGVSWEDGEIAGGMPFGLAEGSHLRAMADRNTDLYRAITRAEADLVPIAEAVATGPWSRVTLPGVPSDDASTNRLIEAFEAEGWLVHSTFRERCPIIDTSGEFEDYRRSLSGNARRQISKARRRLEREGRVELHVVHPVDDLEPVLAESFRLEAAGWKGRSNSAILSSERDTRFWRSVFGRFQELGAVRFSELRLDGSLIAFCLGIVGGQRLYTMKTAYDERYSYFAPGHILRLGMVERCFESELEAQELLGPMIRWKERYATSTRDTVVVRAYRRRPGGAARYLGRRLVLPVARPAYERTRSAVARARGRRGAAPGQAEEVRVDVGGD